MKKLTIKSTFVAAAFAVASWAVPTQDAQAAGAAPKPPAQDWSWNGIFGTFDRASAQRGFQVFKENCASCHGLELIAFRNLAELGYSEDQVKAIASEYEVEDGPNDDGEMFTRPARAADRWPNPFPNKKAAAAANNGKAPPDLSLITKSRGKGADSHIRISLKNPTGFPTGADYVYALLTGYVDAPDGFDVPDGGNYNEYYPGHVIAMAQPLYEEGIEYTDGTAATIEQQALDITTFLAWTAEPELEDRKQLGIKVMLFLLVLTGMLYAVKRKIWADVY